MGNYQQNRCAKNIFSEKLESNVSWSNKMNCSLAKLLLMFAMGFVSPAYAQNYLEVEPNTPCLSPQDLGSTTPIQVTGYKELIDVDFYKFSAPAGTQLRVKLDPDFSSQTPLTALNVGFFTSDCSLQDVKRGYDSAFLDITVPADGVFILGATELDNWNFSEVGGLYHGGYVLSVAPPLPPTVITGRVVDANTNVGLSGFSSPNVIVKLQDCSNYSFYRSCREVGNSGYGQPDSQGNFSIQGDFFDGDFRVQVYADRYLYEVPAYSPTGPTGYESVPVAAGTSYDLGDIPLIPTIPVKSISGKVIDKVTGRPISGTVEPFTKVRAYWLSESGSIYQGEFPVDQNGEYMITSALYDGNPLPLLKGDYRIEAYANQYQYIDNALDLLNVQANEARVSPNLALLSNPIRITDVNPCQNIPAQGGVCNFSYKVTLGTNTPFNGVAWSLVQANGTGGFVNGTRFQACKESLSLIPKTRNASKVMKCEFTVPAKVPDYAYFCPDVRIGQGGSAANSYFTVQGVLDYPFCLSKLPGQGNFKVLSQHEANEVMRHKIEGGQLVK